MKKKFSYQIIKNKLKNFKMNLIKEIIITMNLYSFCKNNKNNQNYQYYKIVQN